MIRVVFFLAILISLASCKKDKLLSQTNVLPTETMFAEPSMQSSNFKVALLRSEGSAPQYMVAFQHKNYAVAFNVGQLATPIGSSSPKLVTYELMKMLGGQRARYSSRTADWLPIVNDGYCGESYYTYSASATMSFTTSNHATKIGMYDIVEPKSTFMVVELNGDKTLANALPTAQELVNNAVLPNTVLISNGGTLDPTWRILNRNSPKKIVSLNSFYGKARRIVLAENLPAQTYTVTFRNTNYKPAGLTTAYTSLAGIWFNDTSAKVSLYPKSQFEPCDEGINLNVASDINFAFAFFPTGSTNKIWVGHGGSQFLDSLKLQLDNLVINPATAKQTTLAKKITLRINASCKSGSWVLAKYIQNMTFTSEKGVEIDYNFEWKASGAVSAGYLPHLAVNNNVNQGVMNGVTHNLVLDNAAYYNAITNTASMKNTTSNWKITCSSSNHTGKVMLEDRLGGGLNKIYFVKYTNTPIQVNDTFSTRVTYGFAKD